MFKFYCNLFNRHFSICMLLHTKRQDFKILVFCNMRCVILFVTVAEFVFYFYWSWNGRRIRVLDLLDFTDDVVHEQSCIHLPAYSAYVTNKTKKPIFPFCSKMQI